MPIKDFFAWSTSPSGILTADDLASREEEDRNLVMEWRGGVVIL